MGNRDDGWESEWWVRRMKLPRGGCWGVGKVQSVNVYNILSALDEELLLIIDRCCKAPKVSHERATLLENSAIDGAYCRS